MMKRRRLLITGVLLLLGGAIVNVAVAWATSLYSRERPTQWVKAEPIWISKVPLGYKVRSDNIVRGESFGLTQYWREIKIEDIPHSFVWDFQEVICAGFPYRSLWMQCVAPGVMVNPKVNEYWLWPESHVNGVPLLSSLAAIYDNEKWRLGMRSRYLPVNPLWPGFAINTIFYAAMLWVVFFVPGMVRRTIRRRRGLCPACAYPTWGGGTSPVCTECGKSLA